MQMGAVIPIQAGEAEVSAQKQDEQDQNETE
jgi:hypothetical protein